MFVEEDDEDEAPAPKKSGTGLVFPSFGKTTSSVATMAEREVRLGWWWAAVLHVRPIVLLICHATPTQWL